MTMIDCPCCLPPWDYTYGSEPAVYFGSSDSPACEIARFGCVTGSNPTSMQATPTGVRGIACDDKANVYYVSGSTVFAMDVHGNTLWTAAHGGLLRGVAVSQSGYVYSCDATNGRVKQWNAVTGAAGWEYEWDNAVIAGVCVDKSGNVYATGGEDGAGNITFSLNSSGGERWRGMSGTNTTGRCVAINAANTNLAVGAEAANTAYATAFVRSAATGASISAVNRGGQCWSCAYAKNGDLYFSGGVNSLGFYMLFNGINVYNISGQIHVYGVSVGPDGTAYLALSNYTGGKPTKSIGLSSWNKALPLASQGTYTVEHSAGRCGAFG